MPHPHGHSPNYDYVIDRAVSLAGPDGRVLDFGCGFGNLLKVADKRRVDARLLGVDTFEGAYQTWRDKVPDSLEGRIDAIEEGRIPHEDASFDVVVSNQVFEHIIDPPPSLAEIARVLKPGGAFLALFPTVDVWYEGHVGVYFAHWLQSNPQLQERYLLAARNMGFGLYAKKGSNEDWARDKGRVLQDVCFYHTLRDVQRWWLDAFGAEPSSLAADYMRYRIAAHPRFGGLDQLAALPGMGLALAWICHRRAGRVFLVRKAS